MLLSIGGILSGCDIHQDFDPDPSCRTVVTTHDARNVAEVSADLDASYVLSTKTGTTIQEAGFYFRPAGAVRDQANDWTLVPATGTATPFTAEVTGLDPLTEYIFYAFVRVAGEQAEIKGAEKRFTTLKTPVPTIVETWDYLTQYTLEGSFVLGEDVAFSEAGFLFNSEGDEPVEYSADNTPDPGGDDFYYYFGRLPAGTYSYTAYVRHTDGSVVTGERKNFTLYAQSEPPSIDPIANRSRFVFGSGIAGAQVTVIMPGGDVVTVTVENGGFWEAQSQVMLTTGQVVYAYQTEPNKTQSLTVSRLVSQSN